MGDPRFEVPPVVVADPTHAELLAAARVMPRGILRRWTLPWLTRLPVPAPAWLPRGVTREVLRPEGVSAGLRVIRPSDARFSTPREARPLVLWLHGGGFVMGSAAQDDRPCARMAVALDAVVVSVDYRLAPGHPFPAALEDCVAAWKFLHASRERLGIDPSRAIVAGQSAGGGLAATMVGRLIDEELPVPRQLVLVYPMLDDRTGQAGLVGTHHRVWDAESNRIAWAAYLGVPGGSAEVPAAAVPARRTDLSGFPPTWIGVGTHDLFYAENVEYAARLRATRVPVELEVVPGAFHGFEVVVPNATVSRAFVEARLRAMAAALA